MPARRLTALIGFVLEVAAVILQFILTLQTRWLALGDSLPGTLIFFFTFFTILTNIMLLLIYLSELVDWPWLAWWRTPVTRGMMAGAIALVGIFNHLLLSHLQVLTELRWLADFALHYIAPVYFVVWWVLFQPKGTLRFADIPIMLLPTLIWLIWAMARGAVVDEYPYPILNATSLGYPAVALNCLFVFVGLVVIYHIVVWFDRWQGRRLQAPRIG
jgi:hypothetical protein